MFFAFSHAGVGKGGMTSLSLSHDQVLIGLAQTNYQSEAMLHVDSYSQGDTVDHTIALSVLSSTDNHISCY